MLVGNIATAEAAEYLIENGVSGIKVGIGPLYLHHPHRGRRGCAPAQRHLQLLESGGKAWRACDAAAAACAIQAAS